MEERKPRLSIVSSVENEGFIPTRRSIINEQTYTTSSSYANTSGIESSENNQFQTKSKIMENFIIAWLCSNNDDSIGDRQDLVMQLKHVISEFNTFTDINECTDFLTDISNEKVIMIIHDYPDQFFFPLINEIPQLYSVYIFDHYPEKYEQITKQFKIVKGTYAAIEQISNAIKQDAYRLVTDLTPISVISPNSSLDLDQLDQSFMYTQLLKEIIIDIEYDALKAREEFTKFCLGRSDADGFQPNAINYFQRCYEDHAPIWWYTKEWFIYSSLNRALRMQDVELITKMAFFVQDLHRQIEKQHSEKHDTSKIIVYRGQALSNDDFKKLRKSKGGLFSFNSFLSTSFDRDVSLLFADSNQQNQSATAVLFKMEIDPSISSTPFARIGNISQFESELEVLFSMHTVFRIGDMNQLDQRLWEVNLILTSDDDQQLRCLTDYIRNEIGGRSGWLSMAVLMFKMGKYEKVIEVINMLHEVMSEEDSEVSEVLRTLLDNGLGAAQQALGNPSTALLSYEKASKIVSKAGPYSDILASNLYCNIGAVYQSLGEFSSALFNYEKALEKERQSLSPDSNLLATIYSNLGMTHQSLGSFPNALTHLEKALELREKSLPPGHPDLGMTFNNIGLIHQSLGNYSAALGYFEKTLAVQQKFLPSDHPHLSLSYNNIGTMHQLLGWSLNALMNFERASEILQKSLPSDHPDLASIHQNIGTIHRLLGNYSTALSYLNKTLEIQQKSLPSDHPNLALVHHNIATVHQLTGDHAIALSHYEDALKIYQQTLPPNHPYFADTFTGIGTMHQSLGNYSTALRYYEKTLEIQQKTLPPYHPDIARTYDYITSVNNLNHDYLSLVTNAEKAFECNRKLLASNQLSPSTDYSDANGIMEAYSSMLSNFKRFEELRRRLIQCYGINLTVNQENIGEVEELRKTLLNAMLSAEKVVEFQKKYPSLNQQFNSSMQINGADTKQMTEHLMTMISHFKKGLDLERTISSTTGEQENFNDDRILSPNDQCSLGVSSLQKVYEIQQKYIPSNNVSSSVNYNQTGQLYYSTGDYENALSSFEKALENLQKCSPINQQILAQTYSNIAKTLEGLGRYDEAIDYAEKASTITRST